MSDYCHEEGHIYETIWNTGHIRCKRCYHGPTSEEVLSAMQAKERARVRRLKAYRAKQRVEK